MAQIASQSIEIEGTAEAVWHVITDIANAVNTISGIKHLQVLEEPTGPSIVGLKWEETREMFGKDATEVMWITNAESPSFYETRAESHGSVYLSRLSLDPAPSGTRLTMEFDAQPVSFGARLMWLLTGWLAKKSVCKLIDQDLNDIKSAVEQPA